MKPTTRKPAATKPVVIIARYFIKRTKAVVYACRPSKGGDPYYTTVINGRATGCTCPARKPCRHMTTCQTLEQERVARVEAVAVAKDRSFVEAVLDKAYEVRAVEITEQGTLRHTREIVSPIGTSSSEAVLAARGWMR